VAGPGLRELKKQTTRRLLSETAWRLFAERGFEHVTVLEVARAAQVSEGTLFNYFPTKESLVFDPMLGYEARLLDAVRERPRGEPALAALARFLAAGADHAAEPGVGDTIATTARMVAGSPTLRGRQEQILAEHTQALAGLLAVDTGVAAGDPGVQAAAHALKGVHRAVLETTRRAALAGERGERLAATVRNAVEAAAAAVGAGFRDFAPRPDGG